MIDGIFVVNSFRERYGQDRPRLFRAPGRINLIGEHTDYNDGFVLPMAIEREVVVAAVGNDGRVVRVYSLNASEEAQFNLDEPGEKQRGIWLDYVEGVAQVLKSQGELLSGADMLLLSDVPVGAGLSSSAALEVSTGMAMLSVSGLEVDKIKLALAGQRAEHVYVGTLCGIMDQLVAACGRRGHALLIDCRSLEVTQIPLDTTDTLVVICDTRVKHELSSSEYNTRRAECERGVEILKQVMPGIRALRDVSPDDFRAHEEMLPEPVRSRCRHVVMENERTLRAGEALKTGDFDEVGRLMRESHVSLRDDYEVSCKELDVLADAANSIEGVYGARMTGGGFGGCTVNLVRKDALARFQKEVVALYYEGTGMNPIIYVSEAAEGAGEISVP
jgi:galactokinase